MKTWFKSISIFIVIIIFVSAFSASYTSHNLENLAYVVALGIDKANNGKNKLMVTFQFIKIQSQSSDSSSGESDVVIEQVYADSIDSAINLINSYIGKEVNLTHCSAIVFSSELAKEGIYTEIYSLVNNEEIRPTTSIVISKCPANDYITNAKPNIEKIITKYYDTFSLTSSYTGYSQKISLGRFFNTLNSNTQNPTAILGTLNQEESESESQNSKDKDASDKSKNNSENNASSTSMIGIIGGRNTENVGIAVFKEDVLVGELKPEETICHLLIDNDIKECVISLPSDKPTDKLKCIDLRISPNRKSKISVDTKSENPKITISIAVDAMVLTIGNESDYEASPELENIAASAEQYLKELINGYLNKISKEYDSDIAGFGRIAVAHFLTNKDWNNYNWDEKFKNSTFDVNVNVNVLSSLLLTK